MNIVYATNKNYERYTRLSIDTLLKFNKDVDITILTEDRLSLPYRQIAPIYPDNFHFDGCNEKITKESYFRIFISNTLKKLDKCIYLDSDTLICGDISELWDSNPEYITKARHCYINKKVLEKHGGKSREVYFNAGVLCMNLDALRKDRIVQRANRITKEKSGIKAWLHDQSILNILYGDKANTVDSIFNNFIETYSKVYFDIGKKVKESKILHLLGSKNDKNTKESVFNGFRRFHDYIINNETESLEICFNNFTNKETCFLEDNCSIFQEKKDNFHKKAKILVN